MSDTRKTAEGCEKSAADLLRYVDDHQEMFVEPVNDLEYAQVQALLAISHRLAALDETLRGRPL